VSRIEGGDISRYKQGAQEMDWVAFFTHIVPSNVVGAFAEGDILQVLLFSILFGVAVTRMGAAGHVAAGHAGKAFEGLFQHPGHHS
jgi:aerobic C4-dicarboxylate transport protein